MASFGNYDANEKLPSNCVPLGEYDLLIANCDMKNVTKFQQVQMEFKILNGEFQNRSIFGNYNFELLSPNTATEGDKTAKRMGRKIFGQICLAVGIPQPKETAELLNKVFTAKLKIQPGKAGFDDKNEIVTAKPRGTAPAAEPAKTGKGQW